MLLSLANTTLTSGIVECLASLNLLTTATNGTAVRAQTYHNDKCGLAFTVMVWYNLLLVLKYLSSILRVFLFCELIALLVKNLLNRLGLRGVPLKLIFLAVWRIVAMLNSIQSIH